MAMPRVLEVDTWAPVTMPEPVLEVVCDTFVAAPLAAGAFALDAQAQDLIALALVQRCNRRCAVLCAAWRARAAAQRCRAARLQYNHYMETRQVRRVLSRVHELDANDALHLQIERLVYLRVVTHEIVQRVVDHQPSLLPWMMQQRAAIARELAEAEATDESEG